MNSRKGIKKIVPEHPDGFVLIADEVFRHAKNKINEIFLFVIFQGLIPVDINKYFF